MMKRVSVSAGFGQSLGVDVGAMAKLKYQTLVGEFLELQKDFVSRKRKLHATKQKRETISAAVRFLRRRRNDLLQNQAFNTEEDPVHLSNSYLKSKALKGETSFDDLEAMPENFNRFLPSDSHNGETEGVRDNEALSLKPMNSIIHHKTAADLLGWAILLNWIGITVMLSQLKVPGTCRTHTVPHTTESLVSCNVNYGS